jgi:methionyl-tRNA synthetase
MRELEQEVLKEQAAIMGKTAAGFDWSTLVPLASKEQAAIMGKTAAAAPAAREKPADSERIEIDDFAKVEMRVGVVRTAEKVKKADKLLHLTIDIGEAEPRSIMAGIAAAYEPESLIGRKVAIVANLKPRKLRGLVSDGMIIAASGEDGNPNLVSFLEDAPIGARLG